VFLVVINAPSPSLSLKTETKASLLIGVLERGGNKPSRVAQHEKQFSNITNATSSNRRVTIHRPVA
jgi:hypothetical protein